MPLIDPDKPETEYAMFDNISASFLKAIKQHYTRDAAVAAMEALVPVLGKDWKARLIFGIVAGTVSVPKRISVRFVDVGQRKQKIQAIKTWRALTGNGLVEAKNAIEQSEYQLVAAEIPEESAYWPQEDWPKQIPLFIQDLRQAGYTVEVV